jgi:peptidoglycan/xylan/chitin deacetylase (PgdA/CDA1 family)
MIGIAAGTAGLAFLAWAVRGRSARVFGPSVWRGPRERRALALTFDDGPSESTPEILSVLAEFGVPATFFQLGANVERLPGIARAVAEAGHEIGNHGYGHPLYCFYSRDAVARDIVRAQTAIRTHTGAEPVLFRAPFGARWFGVRGVQRHLDLTGVMWTVIGLDWKLPGEEVARRVLERVHSGAIVCLHDGRELQPHPDLRPTIQALRLLIPRLLDDGYRCATVSRLLAPAEVRA